MDPETFLEIANYVTKLKMYPFFDMAHYAMMCLSVREDLGSGANIFSRMHPLSCWLASMITCFAGSIVANFLLGEPVLIPFKKHEDILLATIVWYCIFYSPFDLVYKLCKFLPCKISIGILKEVQRCKKVYDGVTHAAKIYPNAYLIMVLIGTAKGSGSTFVKPLERLIRGVWTPTLNEILSPTFGTKASLAASILFVVEKKTEYITAPHALVYFGVVIFFVYFKLSSVLLAIHDPFLPFENLFCSIFMGGIWDSLGRAISSSGEKMALRTENKNGKTDKDKKKD